MTIGNIDLATALAETLPAGRPDLFNPYCDRCLLDVSYCAPESRLWRLADHLDCKPSMILVGEAPGYQGCRYSGVAFTSERQIMAGQIPRVERMPRLTTCSRPMTEPSATIVWRVLYSLHIEDEIVLWNAVQMHPHNPLNPLSNRTPASNEFEIGRPALLLLREAFLGVEFVAVGNRAKRALELAQIPVSRAVRHPANGGARAFARGLGSTVYD